MRAEASGNYEPAFELFWESITSPRAKGAKMEAAQRWIVVGRPDPLMLIQRWNAYKLSLGDLMPKDVSRWLRYRMWEDEYGPSRGAPGIPARPVTQPRPTNYCQDHQRRPEKLARFHVPGCPRCKHFEALNAGREATEPSTAADAMPGWSKEPQG